MNNRPSVLRAAFVGLMFMMAAGLFCAEGNGSICGKVVFLDGKPARNAKIHLEIVEPAEGIGAIVIDQKANRKGQFCFHRLLAGYYILTVNYKYSNMQFFDAQAITVEEGKAARVDMMLRQFMEERPSPSMIDADEPMMTTIFDIEKLENIPQGNASGH